MGGQEGAETEDRDRPAGLELLDLQPDLSNLAAFSSVGEGGSRDPRFAADEEEEAEE